jgi:hypothetical protein
MRVQHLIYRIELPSTTEEEKAQVEDLKDVLSKILLYEKTPCPFRRGFTIDLPEEQEVTTPPRRRTVGAPQPKAKKWEMKDIWRREGEDYRPSVSEMNSPEDSEEEQVPHHKENEEPTSGGQELSEKEVKEEETQQDTKPPIRPRDTAGTAETAEPDFTPPTQLEKLPDLEEEADREESPREVALEVPLDDRSRASSIRSFYTSLDVPIADPPSPGSDYHDPEDTIPLYTHIITKVPAPESTHSRDVSEVNITSLNSPQGATYTPTSATHPPSLVSDSTGSPSTDSTTPIYTRSQPRTRTSTTNTTSRSTSLTYATRARSNLTSGFVSRTFSLLSGPPSGLVSIMMTIASRIANGALSSSDNPAGAAYRYDLKGLPVPGGWQDSEEEREFDQASDSAGEAFAMGRLNLEDEDDFEDLEAEDDEDAEDEQPDEEDDFGVPLGNDTPARKGRKNWGWVRSPKASPAKTRRERMALRNDDYDHDDGALGMGMDKDVEKRVD